MLSVIGIAGNISCAVCVLWVIKIIFDDFRGSRRRKIKILDSARVLMTISSRINEIRQGEEMKPYVIIRTYSAGVFAGFLESRVGKEAVLTKARRIYYWAGAATLSQLAMEGTSKPEECKFPCEVDGIILTEAIEILYATNKAKESIAGVKVWEF